MDLRGGWDCQPRMASQSTARGVGLGCWRKQGRWGLKRLDFEDFDVLGADVARWHAASSQHVPGTHLVEKP